MVFIPHAVLLLAVVAISIAFGTASVIFAAPIVVILYVLIKRLYVRDALGEPTSMPGEAA
jgi:predicted PurR-regulated permease PerM